MFYSKWWVYKNVYLDRWMRPKLLNTYLKQIKAGTKPLFIHINKTAGSSIANSMGITEAHITLKEYEKLYLEKFGESLPQNFEVWTSIRNPFDRIASEYYYRILTNQNKMKTHPIAFDDWVQKVYVEKDSIYRDREIMFVPQCHWINGSKEYEIKYIRFENLQEDYKKLANRYSARELTWKKKSGNDNYKNTFSHISIKIIEEVFKEDLEHFNYSY